MAPFRSEAGDRVEDFTPSRCVELVRGATGVSDLDVEALSAPPWTMGAATAKRFRAGWVFLAGDAAHHIPPAGG
jgi:putative polyketide hydroxylase